MRPEHRDRLTALAAAWFDELSFRGGRGSTGSHAALGKQGAEAVDPADLAARVAGVVLSLATGRTGSRRETGRPRPGADSTSWSTGCAEPAAEEPHEVAAVVGPEAPAGPSTAESLGSRGVATPSCS